MKKIILLLTIVMAVAADAMAQNNAMYVYRNDGGFNAFLKSEVDSMVCSQYDADGVLHNDWQMQVIYTADSIYRIPLTAIDSITFVAPKTEYKEGTTHLSSDWNKYIVSIGEDSITLAKDIPQDLLPQKGDVIFTTINDNDFGKGFAGRVENITTVQGNYVIACSDVTLKDIYKTLVCVGKSKSVSSNEVKAKTNSTEIDEDFNFPEFTVNVGPVNLSVKPIITASYSVCIMDGKQTCATYSIDQTYECSAQLDCNIKGEYKPDPMLIPMPTISFGATGFYAQFSLGGFFEASAGAVISGSQRFTLSNVTNITYTDDAVYYDDNGGWKRELQDPEFSVNGEFTMTAGFAGRFTFNWINDKLASVGVTAKIGPQIDVNFKLSSDGLINKSLYTTLKDSQLKLNAYYSLQAGYRFAGQAYKDFFQPVELTLPVNSWYLLPEFSGLSWDKEANAQGGRLSGNIYRNLLMRIQVGWALYDNDNLYRTVYFPDDYRKLEDWGWSGIGYQFGDLPWGARFSAYPLIKILGQEMIADEKADVKVDPFVKTGDASDISTTTVNISGEVQGLQYAVVAQKGVCYSTDSSFGAYQYAVSGNSDGSFSVTLNDLKPNTKYYYCSYASLDGEYTYGEVYSFQTVGQLCPDDHHPHAIDLGLPSGTKWCCMNVGATAPEGYGGYYAWGETSEKSTYTWENYAYYNSSTGGFYNIGSDIAGTSYDAAHVNMGGSWVMPSTTQQQELINNCSREWTQQNGINGILVTGPNGGKIFLPAAGVRWSDGLYGAGSYGNYWSSSLHPNDSSGAYSLDFVSGSWGWDQRRPQRRSVRTCRLPVAQNLVHP